MPPQQTPVRAVAEIAINVSDISKLREFYEKVLGFEFFRQHPAENPTIVFLKIVDLETPLGQGGHPLMFVLIDVNRHPYAIDRFSGTNIKESTFNHIAFEIAPDAFETEKQRLETLGLAPEVHERRRIDARSFFFNDPEGNWIEFICHNKAN